MKTKKADPQKNEDQLFFSGYLFILEWRREATIYSDNITVDKFSLI